MKNLFTNFFSKKNEVTYTFSEFHPIEVTNASKVDTYSLNLLQAEKQSDEMSIDNIYQSV
jgi:hypothetical protein